MSAMGRSPDLQRRPITGGQRPTVDVATAFWAAVERSDDRRWRDLQRYEPIAAESGPSVLHDCFRTRCIHDSI